MELSELVEFLRFGSSIPGGYWGCCAGDIIQAFKTLPDEPASCQSVNGDEAYPEKNDAGEDLFFGPTNRELFLQRFRRGTFGCGDMPNHFFLLVLTEEQIDSSIGKAWLPILKELGFEFIRTVNNSVWDVNNYIFGLFRNCGPDSVIDQFTPPKAWTDLPSNGKTELWEYIAVANHEDPAAHNISDSPVALTDQYQKVDQVIWDKVGPRELLTEKQIREAGAPVILAGRRSRYPQELKEEREYKERQENRKQEGSLRAVADKAAAIGDPVNFLSPIA